MALKPETVKTLELNFYQSKTLMEASRLSKVDYQTALKYCKKFNWKSNKDKFEKEELVAMDKIKLGLRKDFLAGQLSKVDNLVELLYDEILKRGLDKISMTELLRSVVQIFRVGLEIRNEFDGVTRGGGEMGNVTILFNSPIPRSFTPELVSEDFDYEIINDNDTGNRKNNHKLVPIPKRRRVPESYMERE